MARLDVLYRCPPAPATAVAGVLAVALASLSGCTVGPAYRAPEAGVPAQWQGPHAPGARDAATLARWWHRFGDPTLDSLVAEALDANLDLATARQRLLEARARRDLARAGLAPSVNLSADASRSRSSRQAGSGTTRSLYDAGFDASWEPDVFGATRRGVEAAEADLAASAEDLHATRVSLVAEVALDYVSLRTTEQRLALTRESLATQQSIYDLTRWRREAGLVSELDEAQALTQLESTRATLPVLETSASELRHGLEILLGRNPAAPDPRLVATGRIPRAPDAVSVGIPAETLRQRPDVRAAERRFAAQWARRGEAQAARYPVFSLRGSLGLQSLTLDRLIDGGAGTTSLLAAITAPVFDAGRIRSNIEVQDALLEQSRLGYRATVLGALEDVENALVALQNSRQRHARLTRARDSARSTLEMARQQYAAGLIDFQTVLDSQRTLLGLEDQLASGSGDYSAAQIRLYKALGGGWSPVAATADRRSVP